MGAWSWVWAAPRGARTRTGTACRSRSPPRACASWWSWCGLPSAVRDAKCQIGFYYTTSLYHSILDLHGMREVGEKCRAALRTFDIKAMAEAVPDELVDEIAIACTPDEARDRLAQWQGLTDTPLLYAPSVGVPRERLQANLALTLDSFGGA